MNRNYVIIYPSTFPNVSYLGMDMGEFMLVDDIEFLNQLASTGILTGINKGVDM